MTCTNCLEVFSFSKALMMVSAASALSSLGSTSISATSLFGVPAVSVAGRQNMLQRISLLGSLHEDSSSKSIQPFTSKIDFIFLNPSGDRNSLLAFSPAAAQCVILGRWATSISAQQASSFWSASNISSMDDASIHIRGLPGPWAHPHTMVACSSFVCWNVGLPLV